MQHGSVGASGRRGARAVTAPAALPPAPVQKTTTLMATDGTVIEPTPAELEAAAEGNATRPWLGCIVAQAVMSGRIVEMLDGVASAEDCCRRTRANEKANLYNYCPANRTEACRCVRLWARCPGRLAACLSVSQCSTS